MTDKSGWWLALVGAIGGIVGVAITGTFNYLSHRNDLDAKMIELSIGILRSDPKPETKPLREWAIDVISKRAGFSFDDQQRATLLKEKLPFSTGGSSAAPGNVAYIGPCDNGFQLACYYDQNMVPSDCRHISCSK